MDFKIGDEISEEDNSKKGMSNGVKMAIVIGVSLVTGFSVFFITNMFFGPKKDNSVPVTTETLELTDSIVTDAYEYVTYGVNKKRNDKFLKENKVTVDDFTNEEKFYYALMFAGSSDFTVSGKKDENGLNIYSISNDKINNYMQKYFGDKITYTTSEPIQMTFNFSMENKNQGQMKYDLESDAFLTTFSSQQEVSNDLIEPYYYKLSEATKTEKGLELKEKVIYTDLVKVSDDNYTINIYSDYGKTKLLESIPNMSGAAILQNPILIDNYEQRATEITYTFRKNDSGYYFESSSITK